MAGLGNVMDEVCYKARIHPARPACDPADTKIASAVAIIEFGGGCAGGRFYHFGPIAIPWGRREPIKSPWLSMDE